MRGRDPRAASENDPLYQDAVRLVVEFGKASTSLLQRRLRIGYGRAAHLIDLMEQDGIVGAADGPKPREVLKRPTGFLKSKRPCGKRKSSPSHTRAFRLYIFSPRIYTAFRFPEQRRFPMFTVRRGLYHQIVPFLVVCLAALAAWGADFWTKKPYQNWSAEEKPHSRRIALGHDAEHGLGANQHNQWRLTE